MAFVWTSQPTDGLSGLIAVMLLRLQSSHFLLTAALRDGRGTAWLGALSLDARLGLRVLAKYPGLTIVGVLGISVAVAVGTLRPRPQIPER